MLDDKFSIPTEECQVSVTLDDDGELERILITLYGPSIWRDSDEIKEYLTRVLECEVWVAIG